MKKIEAIIKRANFPTLSTEFAKLGYAIIERRNLDDTKIIKPRKNSDLGISQTIPLSKIELVVSDKDARKIVNIISKNSGLSTNPHGKIFISEMTEVVDMKTMEGEKELEHETESIQKQKIKRNRLVPLQKYTLIKLEKIYDENFEILKNSYRIKSFSDFVNHCIMNYVPTLERQLKHPNVIFDNNFRNY